MPINKVFPVLVALLRLGIGRTAEASVAVSPDTWREVCRLAKKHAVLGIAWDGVEQLQVQSPEAIHSLPADLMGKWFADAQAIAAANARMASQAAEVQAMLQQGGFESLILKGASLAAYYPHPAHRQASDIDLWVLPKQAGQSLADHRRALFAFLQRQDITIDAVVYHHIETTIRGTDVEMHITPTWLCNPCHNRRLQQLFARIGQLTPEEQELYCLLHAFRHIYHDGLALRHVLDYHLVSRHNRETNIPAPEALYCQLGLRRFARVMDELSAHLFAPQTSGRLSAPAQHMLAALPERRTSRRARWDYPAETLCVLLWRCVHYLWRRWNNY